MNDDHPVMTATYQEMNWLDLWEWNGFGEYEGVHYTYGWHPDRDIEVDLTALSSPSSSAD